MSLSILALREALRFLLHFKMTSTRSAFRPLIGNFRVPSQSKYNLKHIEHGPPYCILDLCRDRGACPNVCFFIRKKGAVSRTEGWSIVYDGNVSVEETTAEEKPSVKDG